MRITTVYTLYNLYTVRMFYLSVIFTSIQPHMNITYSSGQTPTFDVFKHSHQTCVRSSLPRGPRSYAIHIPKKVLPGDFCEFVFLVCLVVLYSLFDVFSFLIVTLGCSLNCDFCSDSLIVLRKGP